MGQRDYRRRYVTMQALRALGPEALPLLIEVAGDAGEHVNIRRDAILAMGECGKPDQVEELIARLLGEAEWQLVGAAAESAARLRIARVLPQLVSIARSELINQNARYAAIRGVVGMAPREEAAGLLMELAQRGHNGGVRGMAISMLAGIEWRQAIPMVLDALEDPDSHVRTSADRALRSFSGKPEGVGCNCDAGDNDARRREAEKWRVHFR